jgi:uncharacterized membrane protein
MALKVSIMKDNVGKADKIIRLILGVVLLVLFYAEIVSGYLAYGALILAVVFVLTSMVSFCPLYRLFRINSIKRVKQ